MRLGASGNAPFSYRKNQTSGMRRDSDCASASLWQHQDRYALHLSLHSDRSIRSLCTSAPAGRCWLHDVSGRSDSYRFVGAATDRDVRSSYLKITWYINCLLYTSDAADE